MYFLCFWYNKGIATCWPPCIVTRPLWAPIIFYHQGLFLVQRGCLGHFPFLRYWGGLPPRPTMQGPKVAVRRVKIKRFSHLQIEWSYSNLTIRRKILEPSMAEIGGICPLRDRKIGKRVGPRLWICDRTPWEKLISIHTDPVTLTGGQQVSPLFSRHNEKSFSWTLKLNFDIFIMFTPKNWPGYQFSSNLEYF